MYPYVSVDRVFSKLDRDVTSEFSEDDIIEWIGEALEFMKTPRMAEPYVAFIEVHNHQCPIPRGTHNIVQIARNNAWTGKNCPSMCPQYIKECLDNTSGEDCKVVAGKNPCVCPTDGAVWLDCHGQPIVAYDLAYYRPFFNLKLESFNTFSNTGFYTQNFTPIRLSTNSMFSSLICNPRPSPYNKSHFKDEYQIIQGSTLRFSFKEGAIALAISRQVIDNNTGYPMVPDSISHLTAITSYVTMKIFKKQWYRGRDAAKGKADDAEKDWQWYCGQATSQDMMPQGADEYQNLLDQRQYILPRTNSYYSFFGNLNDPEQRIWNNRFHNPNGASTGNNIVSRGSDGDDIVISNSTEIIEPTWEQKEW